LGAVVEDGVARAHGSGEVEQVAKSVPNALWAMRAVGGGEMLAENRERVAEDEVVIAEWDAPLLGGTVGGAQETFALANSFRIDLRAGRRQARGIELNFQDKIIDLDAANADGVEGRDVVAQQFPLIDLLVQQLLRLHGEVAHVDNYLPAFFFCRARISNVRSLSLYALNVLDLTMSMSASVLPSHRRQR